MGTQGDAAGDGSRTRRGPAEGDDLMEALGKHGLHWYFQALSKPEPRPTRVSLRDIAKRIGVSHVTVSLVVRKKSDKPLRKWAIARTRG